MTFLMSFQRCQKPRAAVRESSRETPWVCGWPGVHHVISHAAPGVRPPPIHYLHRHLTGAKPAVSTLP